VITGRVPIGIKIKVEMENGSVVLVIPVPGLDPGINPGIAPADGVRLDPRIKSGDDDEGAVRPAESLCDRDVILTSMARVPAIRPQALVRELRLRTRPRFG
jgi:hypothetical protein